MLCISLTWTYNLHRNQLHGSWDRMLLWLTLRGKDLTRPWWRNYGTSQQWNSEHLKGGVKGILWSKLVAIFVMKMHDHWCTTAFEDVAVIHICFICYVRPEKVKDEKRPWILRAREDSIQIESTTVHEENQSLPQTLIYISCGWESFKEVYLAFKSILENFDWDAALWSFCLHTICLNYLQFHQVFGS